MPSHKVPVLYEAVNNGTPLDEIRKRIELEKLGYPPSAGYYKAIVKVLQIIDKCESGRWIDVPVGGYILLHRCSKCLKNYDRESKYCPNCGAKMEVEE